MATEFEKNPLRLRLLRVKERTTKNADLYLVEKDGGSIYCPYPAHVKGRPVKRACSSNCAWFFTTCNIPEKLGLAVPPIE